MKALIAFVKKLAFAGAFALGLSLPVMMCSTTAFAGACPLCTTAADCGGNFCVLWTQSPGCGTDLEICCPGQGCNVQDGCPSCVMTGDCTIVDGPPTCAAGTTSVTTGVTTTGAATTGTGSAATGSGATSTGAGTTSGSASGGGEGGADSGGADDGCSCSVAGDDGAWNTGAASLLGCAIAAASIYLRRRNTHV